MKKNILVVDDSALMRRVLCDIINSDDDFQAIDTCRDGQEAYEVLKTKHYDGVVLDVNMPHMDGLQLLEKLQKEHIQVTVVMASTLTTENATVTIRAMELGAVDFVTKPENIIEAKGQRFKEKVLDMLTAVLNTKELKKHISEMKPVQVRKTASYAPKSTDRKLIALACSTGGPKALQSVIPFLKKEMDAPMLLVQHMPAGFTKSMADRLNEISKVTVKEAEDGELLEKGTVYIAPGGKHLELAKASDGKQKIHLSDAPAIGGLRPCANVMYRSLTQCSYDEIICVVLTGMGADGTDGIVELDKSKKVHVIAQDASTCVVYGMPRAIAESNLVDEVVPLEKVADAIMKNVGVK